MSPGNPRDPHKEQFWRDHLQRWQRSGLSARAYCRRQRLSAPSFYGWRRTLADRDRATPTEPTVAFLPLHVRHDPLSPDPAPLELVLGNGRRLRIPAGFPPDCLRAVLALLEGPSCSAW